MLPPLLDIYVVWHPEDSAGSDIADSLIDHFHGTPFSGLIGGAVEVFVRSAGWREKGDAPLPLPYVEPLPYGVPEAELTVVVPVVGLGLASALQDEGPWADYIDALLCGAAGNPDTVLVLPVRLSTAPRNGNLQTRIGFLQSIAHTDDLRRDVSQAIAQFAAGNRQRLKVFLSHTKHSGEGGDAPAELVRSVRDVILDTKLQEFFDESDLRPGYDWSAQLIAEARHSALLAIRTDRYASRTWCQREVLTAKRAGMPAVILDALTHGEERGSFLMDNLPRIPRGADGDRAAILQALGQLVDECLKRALWRRQRDLAERTGLDLAAWWAPHAPEPVTFVEWLQGETGRAEARSPTLILHPDPPLGPDETAALRDVASLCGLGEQLEILTPRGLAIRGG